MHEYLVHHALENVWCSPGQDNQVMLAPKRITPARGALNYAEVLGDVLSLPVKKKPFHLFQVGQLDPVTLGLLRQVPNWRTQRWFKFSDAVNAANMEVTIYNGDGVNLPRTGCYYIFLDDRALVFAVPEVPRFPVKLETEQIYFRFYRNAYFRTPHEDNRSLSCGSFTPNTTPNVLAMEEFLNAKKALPGYLRTYKNGLLSEATLGNVQFGDYIEWVHDFSIKNVWEWKLSSLHQFRSELDNTYKYLLHHQQREVGTIDFQDDIDVYVTHHPTGSFSHGVYYSRNRSSMHRMVTHRDYSVTTQAIIRLRDALMEDLGLNTPNSDDVYVRIMVRHGGVNRELVMDNNRVFELYKLDIADRLRAMSGIDATVPEWSCAALEKSAYNALMRTPRKDVTIDVVQAAYGYNACSVILADTPTKTVATSGNQIAMIPYGLQRGSTVYELDTNGHLLGFYPHVNDNEYEARNPECRMVEAVLGLPSETTDTVFGQTYIPLPVNGNSYRVYRCYLFNGVPDNKWEDITGSADYTVVNNNLIWLSLETDQWLMVRGDGTLLAYDLSVRQNDGLLNFTVMENVTGNPVEDMTPLEIPLSQLDIWMNKRKLIEGLDFFVQFPEVVITNKTFLLQPVNEVDQEIHVRMMGLPGSDMKLDPVENTGWITNGSLSNNSRFDLRDDKVLQINVGGSIRHRSDLMFGEDRPGASMLNPLNGLPYQIKDIIVAMQSFIKEDTYSLRAKSMVIDARVSDYLTLKFGEMESTEVSAITARYPVVSPFFSHLTHLLMAGQIVLPSDRILEPMEVLAICEVHEKLFQWDPLHHDHTPDSNFSYIVPHGNETAIPLNFQAYRFLAQVAGVYGQGKIEISDYITLITE